MLKMGRLPSKNTLSLIALIANRCLINLNIEKANLVLIVECVIRLASSTQAKLY